MTKRTLKRPSTKTFAWGLILLSLFVIFVGYSQMVLSEFYPEFVSTTVNYRPDCPEKVNPGPECIASLTTTVQDRDGRVQALPDDGRTWIKARQATNREHALRTLTIGLVLATIGVSLHFRKTV